MVWHAPKTWVPFEEVDADEMNEQLRDNPAYLKDHVDALETNLAAESTARAAGDTQAVGGVLSGSLPNPGFAVDMATQAELDGVAAAAASSISSEATTRASDDSSEAAARAAEDATLLKTDGSREMAAAGWLAKACARGYNPVGALGNSGGFSNGNNVKVTINKRQAASDLIVTVMLSLFAENSNAVALQATVDDPSAASPGTDISNFHFNDTFKHSTVAGACVISGVSAGAHEIQITFDWEGTDDLRSDGTDNWSLIVEETYNT